MGKQGPCYHCGVPSTPLWRNGPPEKPVLCNACGSRWRTKGTLANYTPLRARAEPDDFEEYRVFKVKNISFKSKETNVSKRKQSYNNEVVKVETVYSDQNFHKVFDEEASNRSTSSAISYSDSCSQFGSTDASEFTGSSQPVVWDTLVPSRKRSCMSRPKPSSVEKLTQDLFSILHEQQSPYFSGSSEEDLLFESEAPMVSVEIGHGSVLMKLPNAPTREEDSEASSLSVDNKSCTINEAYSGSASIPVNVDKVSSPMGHGTQEQTKRDKSHLEKFQLLQNHSSPLRSIDIENIEHKQIKGGKGIETEPGVSRVNNSVFVKKHLDGQNQKIQEAKSTMRSPRRVVTKANYDMNDIIDNGASCFSPRSLFAPPPDTSSLLMDAFQFSDYSCDQDLLLDVPSKGSFPQAELLYPSSTFNTQQASTSNSLLFSHLIHP